MKQDWEIKKLKEVLKIQNGYAFDAKLFTIEEGTPLIRIRDIKVGVKTVTNFKGKYDKKYEVNAGDFLIGRDGDFGCYEWKGDTALLNQRVCRLQEFSSKLYPRFLFYGINKYLKAIEEVTAFATVKHISSKQIENIEIPLPPFPEQQRIVAILDDAFTKIEKAKANAEQNLKNAKELFESYLQGVFENKGDDWEEKTLGDIGKPSMCKRILKNQTSSTGDIPFYKIGTFGKTPNAYISQEIYDEFRAKYSFPKKGDVLISASGTIGRRVRYDGEPAFFQDSNIVWIDNDEKQVLNDYLYVFYEFCDWQPSKGATISRLYNSNLTSVKIAFPKSFKEQNKLLDKINRLSIETKKLEAIYQQKTKDLEELKKSVLQKAFSGELK